MARSLLLLIFLFISLSGFGQSIGNVRATFEGGKITVTYDITGGNDKQTYNIALYSSHDNYAKPLMAVTGDVGNNLSGGVAKKVVWDAKVDLGEYKGALTFRVSADPIPLPYTFTKPVSESSYRRGKVATISWDGGALSENVSIELLINGTVVQQISSARNSGVQNWSIPKDMTKGTVYQLRLRSSGGQTVISDMFSIKNKVPLALKIAPVFLIGGAIAAFSGGGSPGPEPTINSDLPAAPKGPDGN